jgi:phospholipid/cholesterol/gamma-HCH transport system permease protein
VEAIAGIGYSDFVTVLEYIQNTNDTQCHLTPKPMNTDDQTSAQVAGVRFEQPSEHALQMTLTGDWRLAAAIPSCRLFDERLTTASSVTHIAIDAANLGRWDTSLVTFVAGVYAICLRKNIALDISSLPDGAQRLVKLAYAVPAKKDTGHHGETQPLLAQIGTATLDKIRSAPEMLTFAGEILIAFARFLRGKAQYRRADLLLIIEETGARALPIVSLISFLVGVIVAYMGAVQLAQFGAQIYIADLVGIGMVREMGALMTGIIVAGRSGAAFAAQLGTMQVNEEIDAYKSLGIAPTEYLVLPRVLALVTMMPLLTLYSGVVGMFAGLFVSTSSFDIGVFEYYHQTVRALDLRHFAIGVFKGTVYGILIAFSGCLRGMQCGRSAQAVGQATTSAVVTSIVFIVIAASVLTIVFQQLGI